MDSLFKTAVCPQTPSKRELAPLGKYLLHIPAGNDNVVISEYAKSILK